jgi:DNA polymerase-4
VTAVIPPATKIMRVSATLGELTLDTARQPDLFSNDDKERQRCEALPDHGRSHLAWPDGGECRPLAARRWYVGSKISYTRIPEAEDNW